MTNKNEIKDFKGEVISSEHYFQCGNLFYANMRDARENIGSTEISSKSLRHLILKGIVIKHGE
tara:strand:- start:817 stop:1005 length:189 start_codon:yes stop_codon:yes gene_type:complete